MMMMTSGRFSFGGFSYISLNISSVAILGVCHYGKGFHNFMMVITGTMMLIMNIINKVGLD